MLRYSKPWVWSTGMGMWIWMGIGMGMGMGMAMGMRGCGGWLFHDDPLKQLHLFTFAGHPPFNLSEAQRPSPRLPRCLQMVSLLFVCDLPRALRLNLVTRAQEGKTEEDEDEGEGVSCAAVSRGCPA